MSDYKTNEYLLSVIRDQKGMYTEEDVTYLLEQQAYAYDMKIMDLMDSVLSIFICTLFIVFLIIIGILNTTRVALSRMKVVFKKTSVLQRLETLNEELSVEDNSDNVEDNNES